MRGKQLANIAELCSIKPDFVEYDVYEEHCDSRAKGGAIGGHPGEVGGGGEVRDESGLDD